jgi:purine-binding chemotaxis protein CheW
MEVKNSSNEKSNLIQLVSFKIGTEEFGVDILKVQEINKLVQITKVPNAPYFVEGVINLRGRIIPIVDLRTRLGLPRKDFDKNTRIVVIDLHGKTIGFIVDAVNEVLRISNDIIEPPPTISKGVNADYITSVAKLEDRLLILLDLEKLLSEEEKEKLAEAANS